MLRVFYIRHGETDWNRDRRIMGNEAIPINDTGTKQAHSTRQFLREVPVSQVYSSPILRAQQTAEILIQDKDLSLIKDSRLEEVSYGEYTKKTFDEVHAMPGYIPYYKRLDTPVAPGGETLYQVLDRGIDFMTGLRESVDQNVWVISHADWIKVLLMHYLHIPFEKIGRFRVDNGSISVVEFHKKYHRVLCVNQRSDVERLLESRAWF